MQLTVFLKWGLFLIVNIFHSQYFLFGELLIIMPSYHVILKSQIYAFPILYKVVLRIKFCILWQHLSIKLRRWAWRLLLETPIARLYGKYVSQSCVFEEHLSACGLFFFRTKSWVHKGKVSISFCKQQRKFKYLLMIVFEQSVSI